MGLPERRPDQRLQRRAPAGVGPAPSGGIVVARRVIVSGPQDGVFVYAGPPAAGDLAASIVPSATTDPYLNSVLAGIASYATSGTPRVAVENNAGAISFMTSATEAGPWNLASKLSVNPTLLTGVTGDLALEYAGAGFIVGSLVYLPPSFDESGGIDTANVAAIFSDGLTPYLLPGTFFINCGNSTLTGLGPGKYIYASGENNTVINAQGAGDLFYWSEPGAYSDQATAGGGIRGGLTIDGSATTGNANGIHAGDILSLTFECTVQNFTAGTASWGFLFDNANHHTERLQFKINAKNCGNTPGNGGGVGFTVSGATGDFSFKGLSGDMWITSGALGHDGLVLMNGALIYDALHFGFSGNFAAASSGAPGAAIRITGNVPAGHPGAGSPSAIRNSAIAWTPEAGSGTVTPIDIVLGTGNVIASVDGPVDFGTNFTSSGLTGGWSLISGLTIGDPALGVRPVYGTAGSQVIAANGATLFPNLTSAAVRISSGGASFTGIILSPAGLGAGQVVWIFKTDAGTLTFDVAGTSNVADGAADVINAFECASFIWDAGTALWYRVKQ